MPFVDIKDGTTQHPTIASYSMAAIPVEGDYVEVRSRWYEIKRRYFRANGTVILVVTL